MSAKFERLGPVNTASVVWVGHSLIQTKVQTAGGEADLMSMVGDFARHNGLAYNSFDHTLWGSPLSALWRGSPHGYERDAAEMAARRETLEREADKFDVMVLTEIAPLTEKIMRLEFSSYYLRKFYCALKTANPAARAYVYETWTNLQGGGPNGDDPPAHRFDWSAQMNAQRKNWRRLADDASGPNVASPGWLSRFGLSRFGLSRRSNAGCTVTDPIYAVPVGDVFVALSQRIQNPQANDVFDLPSGAKLTIADLYANPYVDWLAAWPLKDGGGEPGPAPTLSNLTLRDPTKPHDDIHLSATGVYVAALVHFATLYRRSPIGLPSLPEIGDAAGRTLQQIVWQSVLDEPRTGVASDVDGKG